VTEREPAFVVTYRSSEDATAANRWARALGVPCLKPGQAPETPLSLVMEHGALCIRDNRDPGLKPLSADFTLHESPSKKQPLGRAVGRRTRTVVDATAGWGADARRLCAMGYRVTVVERSAVMAALLQSAVDRAARAGRSSFPVEIVTEDAIDYLPAHHGAWDCVFLDPMFPPKRRSSTLAKRPLRLLRELAGDDPDRGRLFEAAMAAGAKRVVVKRPDHVDPVFGYPDETVAGKLVCYDVYFSK